MNHEETVYTPAELARMWKLSQDTIRRLFRGEPGVRVVSSLPTKRRKHETLRIPAAVAERKWKEMERV